MNFEHILNLGIEKNILNTAQKEDLINLYKQNKNEAEKSFAAGFYYIGGIIMLCAMISLMFNTIKHSSYAAVLILGVIYALLFLCTGEYLWRRKEKLPAEILYLLFIAAFGFILLDIEKMTGFFPHFADMNKYPDYWDMCRIPIIVLSFLTITANTILQRLRQLQLLTAPAIFCSYAIYMCLVNWIFGQVNITEKIMYSSHLLFGIGLVSAGFIKDRQTNIDYSQWMYSIGAALIFASALSLLNEYLYADWKLQLFSCALSLIYVLTGLILQRKSFSIIGILGIIEYILFLEFSFIENNAAMLAGIILMTGFIIFSAGIFYKRNIQKLETFIENKFPQKIRCRLPKNRISKGMQ